MEANINEKPEYEFQNNRTMKIKNVLALMLFYFLSALLFYSANAQSTSWKHDPRTIKGFIENRGQFVSADGKEILYSSDSYNEQYQFTKTGVKVVLFTREKRQKTEEEKAARKERKKQGFANRQEWLEFENEGNRLEVKQDELSAIWIGANENVIIIPEEKNSFYHSYSFYDKNGKDVNENYIPSYKKLTYKNLYDNIDVVYEFYPEGGFKYSIVVHPGGDISQVKLQYSKNAVLNANGTISTSTIFGNITDHAPLTFYARSKNQVIESKYEVKDNVITFRVDGYDKNQTIIIDPWTQSPNFPATNWDSVWETERDGTGNVYIIGGTSPMQLIKYNSAGAIQWTYNTPYDTTAWLGTFATDNAGNSYVSNGSAAAMVKVNTAGGVVWNNPNPGGLLALTEFWTITFNCDQTKLVVGGTDGFAFGGPKPYIFDIDMNSGNVLTSVQVHESVLFNDQEIRAITPCNNAKYYFLSHDTIGYIHQSLSICNQGGGAAFHTSNGIDLGYKCENWRYNNSGIQALEHYNGFVFVHRGNQLQKRNFATAAVVATVAIPGGSYNGGFGGNNVGCSGISIDNCGNIFVGSTNGVYKFDQNLTQTGSFATTFNVYDVEVSTAGDVIACGSTGNSGSASRTGSVQSFAASACAPQAIVCCDATICPENPVCTTDAPFAITESTTGGTFSASCGACINASTGVFNPATAGVGTHTITYTLACGSESITIVVNNCSPLSVCQEANGDYTVSGGTGPYNWYEWFPGGSTPITTQAECTACNASYTWFFGQCLNGVTPVNTCNTPAGWVLIGTGPTITPTGTYPMQVVDNAGTTFDITGPGTLPMCTGCPALTVSTSSQVNVLCFGQSTGSFSASTSGGTGPYDYVLMNGATTVATFNNIAGSQAFTNLPAGTYTLNVTDNNGCPGSTTITITQPAAALAGSSSGNTPASCGSSNGAVTITATGGTAGYNVSWTGPSTGNPAGTEIASSGGSYNMSGLAAGSYTVTITDANGCTTTVSVTINNSGGPTGSSSNITAASCGNSNGSVTITATGGTAGYNVSWTGPSTGNPAGTEIAASGGSYNVIGLAAGSYVITITDAASCTTTVNVTINNTGGPTGSLTSQTNVSCNGDNDGAATVTGSGGTGTLSYSWNTTPVQTGQTASNLPPGTWICTITDANSCTTTVSVTITEPTAISLTLSSTTPATCGQSDGSATVSASGGTGAITVTWNTTPGQTGLTANNLAAGTYVATATDANGCQVTLNVPVGNSGGPTVSLTSQTNVTCNGDADGTATISASGGTGTLTTTWNTTPSQTGTTATNLPAGTWIATVTDQAGCSNAISVTITQPAALSTSVSATPANCAAADGSATATVTGGTGSYSYAWSPSGGSAATASGLTAGNYTVIVTDGNGCSDTASTVVGTVTAANINAGSDVTIEQGDSIQISATGGVSYVWSPATGLSCTNCQSPYASPTTTTTYYVTGTDASGCVGTDSITVYVDLPCGKIFVPNAFSPNGDYANDKLCVMGGCIIELNFQIFDRWGEKVFETTSTNICWDGTLRDKPMNGAVFFYYLSAVLDNGETVVQSGNISLIK
ncbi:MAG: gliding motility-associated C-terminal domain-containing protein [Bacteroidota bacterium]